MFSGFEMRVGKTEEEVGELGTVKKIGEKFHGIGA